MSQTNPLLLLLFCFSIDPVTSHQLTHSHHNRINTSLSSSQKQQTLEMTAQLQGAPDLSNWVWEERLNTSILKG